jgi:nitric oxide dioxygenase
MLVIQEVVEDQLFELGKAHQRYGVTPTHFELMGEALLATLAKVIGRRSCTEKTKKSWKEMYRFMSSTMIQGAAAM